MELVRPKVRAPASIRNVEIVVEEGLLQRAREIDQVIQISRRIRRDIVEMIGYKKAGHFGGSLSIADILAVLYFYKMRHHPARPTWEDRDRFVLSKGHGAPALYAALAEAGYFQREEFTSFKEQGGSLEGHPNMKRTVGIEANTGSLGQGLAIANGIALGGKLLKKDFKIYVLVGDGETNEGEIWEAAMLSAHYKLDNVVCLVDLNGLQAMGPTREIMNTAPMEAKWSAFGWDAQVINGHIAEEIMKALDRADSIKGKPCVIICKTVKGKGISFLEGKPEYHHSLITKAQYEQAVSELGE